MAKPRRSGKRGTPRPPGLRRKDQRPRRPAAAPRGQAGGALVAPHAAADGQRPGGMSPRELEAAVGRLFCDGFRAAQIVEKMAQRGERIARSDVYNRFIPACLDRGLIRYVPLFSNVLEAQLRRQYSWLNIIRVVHAVDSSDVGRVAAEEVLGLLRRDYQAKETHLGFANGHTIAEVALALADLLRVAPRPLPRELWLHILVGALSVAVSADPVVFCSQLADDPAIPIPRKLIRLNAPLIVPREHYEKVMEVEKLDRAFRTRNQIDIVVTSASPWDAESMLRQSLTESFEVERKTVAERGGDPSTVPDPLAKLQDAQGDLLCRPLSEQGEIVEADHRVMGVLSVKDLAEMVARNKRIMLVIGPTRTGKTRTRILRTILRLPGHHISDLVVDERTAQELLDPEWVAEK